MNLISRFNDENCFYFRFLKKIQQQKIVREPYTGEVIDLSKAAKPDDKASSKTQATASSGEPSAAPGFHNRPATRAGPYD